MKGKKKSSLREIPLDGVKTIRDLKRKLQEKHKVDISNKLMKIGDQILNDDDVLADVKVRGLNFALVDANSATNGGAGTSKGGEPAKDGLNDDGNGNGVDPGRELGKSAGSHNSSWSSIGDLRGAGGPGVARKYPLKPALQEFVMSQNSKKSSSKSKNKTSSAEDNDEDFIQKHIYKADRALSQYRKTKPKSGESGGSAATSSTKRSERKSAGSETAVLQRSSYPVEKEKHPLSVILPLMLVEKALDLYQYVAREQQSQVANDEDEGMSELDSDVGSEDLAHDLQDALELVDASMEVDSEKNRPEEIPPDDIPLEDEDMEEVERDMEACLHANEHGYMESDGEDSDGESDENDQPGMVSPSSDLAQNDGDENPEGQSSYARGVAGFVDDGTKNEDAATSKQTLRRVTFAQDHPKPGPSKFPIWRRTMRILIRKKDPSKVVEPEETNSDEGSDDEGGEPGWTLKEVTLVEGKNKPAAFAICYPGDYDAILSVLLNYFTAVQIHSVVNHSFNPFNEVRVEILRTAFSNKFFDGKRPTRNQMEDLVRSHKEATLAWLRDGLEKAPIESPDIDAAKTLAAILETFVFLCFVG